MVMTTGTFAKFASQDGLDNLDTIRDRIQNFSILHEEDGHQLKSVIRLDDSITYVNTNVGFLSGNVYAEYIKSSTFLEEDEENDNGLLRYDIVSRPHVDVKWGQFWILNNGIIFTKIKGDRSFIAHALQNALGTDVHTYNINITRVAEDYTNNWIGGIVDREGNWQKGTLYGDDLRSDNCIGNEFVNCTKNQVGGFTQYFGGLVKFKVTKDGTIIVYTDLNNDRSNFVKFVLSEIRTYFVSE